ncbi:hypothetical protein SDC9_93533 [bioreactor metagenome]|uniref:Uncharacterized protein n=1 Tax=bioreactor metagenome TaxID=1076179 RepID=A0A645A1N7_9ZZZZ
MQIIGAALVVLGALEIRQHIGPAPTRIALLGPVVVVLGLAARIDHGVDRAGAAQHLAARLVAPASAQARLRRGGELPVVRAGLGHGRQPRRAMDEHAAVRPARLDEADADLWILAQTPRQYRARRACPNHDVVEHVTAVSYVVSLFVPICR